MEIIADPGLNYSSAIQEIPDNGKKNEKNEVKEIRKKNPLKKRTFQDGFLSGFKKSRTVSMPGSSGDPGEVYSYKKNVSEDYKSVTSKKTKEQNLNEISVGSRKTEGKLYFLPGSAKRDIVSDPVLHYPPGIKNSGISAVVKIKAKIDQEGRVYAVQFLEKSGFSSLDLSVSRQIRSMRFSNVSMDIPSEFIREYHFKLKSN